VPEIEYTFRNPLTQEAVYKTILLKRRREFHRRVGEAMESIYPDRMEAQYGLLAHHFALAGERDKAIEYARKAAQQAISLYAYDDAVQNLHTALNLIQDTEKSDIHLTLLEELGDVYCLLRDGSQAIETYAQSLELWGDLDSPDPLVEVRLRRKIVQTVTDLKWSVSLEDLQQADKARRESVERLRGALDSLSSEPAHPETLRALVALSADAWRIQDPPDWDQAHEFAQSAVEMAEHLESPVDTSQALGALESVLDGQSRLREHLEIAEQRLEICRRQGFTDLRERLDALRGVGAARMYVGEYAQALPYLDEAGELASRMQAVDQMTNAFGLKAQCLYRMDRWDDVLNLEGKWRELEERYTRERVGET
jgi:tetratricopeptide (TPR) repeat protein